jgi:hypothetical protein
MVIIYFKTYRHIYFLENRGLERVQSSHLFKYYTLELLSVLTIEVVCDVGAVLLEG